MVEAFWYRTAGGAVDGLRKVAEFADEATRSRQDAFPVIGFEGELTGIVLTSQLARIPASERANLRLEQVALSAPPAYQARAEAPAGKLADRPK